MNDWAGWLLVDSSFLILLASATIRRRMAAFLAAVFTLIAHQCVALINTYGVTIKGAESDAVTFHALAAEMSALSNIDWIFTVDAAMYVQFLALFYKHLGASKLLGSQLSLVAFAVSIILIAKIADQLSLRRYTPGLILLAGLLPSVAIFTSVTLRESYQLCFFLLFAHSTLLVRKRPRFGNVITLLLALFGLSLMHKGLAAMSLVFLVLAAYWSTRGGRGWSAKVRRYFVLFVAGMAISAWIYASARFGIGVGAFLTDGLPAYVYSYRQGLSDYLTMRASYGPIVTSPTAGAVLVSLPLIGLLYMFAPFPAQVENALDIYALLEGFLRLILLLFAFGALRRSTGELRSRIGFLFMIFCLIEVMWALGTSNWGQAIRHHVVAYPILVLLGGPGLIRFLVSASRGLLQPFPSRDPD
ncbi:MAG TPA: hypothetical protein VNM92_15400 [Thermoanaerobaculia bacterium]|nr:hypothetical protein [Thermoanaerobaculia bacterium]